MRAMVHFVETTECVVLRASTQAFESMGEYASLMEFATTHPPGDEDILLIAEREEAVKLTEYLDRIVEFGDDGSRSYFWFEYDTRMIRKLGKFASYADAVQEAQRQLIIPKKGMVFDFEKSRQWTLQLARPTGSMN
jgi:hypothetical protein